MNLEQKIQSLILDNNQLTIKVLGRGKTHTGVLDPDRSDSVPNEALEKLKALGFKIKK